MGRPLCKLLLSQRSFRGLNPGFNQCNIRTVALCFHPPSRMEAQDFVSKIHRLEKTGRAEICENGQQGV